jgi:hypothetical protein
MTDFEEGLKDKSIFELTVRLNQLDVERQKLDVEYNSIVHELWRRLPNLKEDVNIQPRVLVKRREKDTDGE